MADFKTILALTKEADLKDLPYYEQLTSELVALIDAANLAEIEYKVIYPIMPVIGALGTLQQERLKLKLVKKLRDLSYIADFDIDNNLIVTWTIATLSKAL